VKLFPWATDKKVGVCEAFASVTHCRVFPCTWAGKWLVQGNISNPRNNALQCHIHTQNCSSVTLGETPKMHEKQQIRTEVELEDLMVALGSPGNNWGMLCTSMSNFAPYA